MRGCQQATRDCQQQLSAAPAVVLARKRGSLRLTAPAGSMVRCLKPKICFAANAFAAVTLPTYIRRWTALTGLTRRACILERAPTVLCHTAHAHCTGVTLLESAGLNHCPYHGAVLQGSYASRRMPGLYCLSRQQVSGGRASAGPAASGTCSSSMCALREGQCCGIVDIQLRRLDTEHRRCRPAYVFGPATSAEQT